MVSWASLFALFLSSPALSSIATSLYAQRQVASPLPVRAFGRRNKILFSSPKKPQRLAPRVAMSPPPSDHKANPHAPVPPIPTEDLPGSIGYFFVNGCHVYLQGTIHGSLESAGEVRLGVKCGVRIGRGKARGRGGLRRGH
eukprot:661648-Amorphochlora_amoeboformis.AAC.3